MSLVRSVTPLADEGLAGLIARAAGANIYPHAADILSQAGMAGSHAGVIASRPLETADRLAEVLGTSPATLRRLYHPQIDSRLIDFFGVPVRAIHRETRKRRLSPRALRDRAYIKAIWSIRPLEFDPDTRERLISHCPVCQRALGFTITWGIEHCEHCLGEDDDGLPQSKVDLRDFPQPLVEVSDDAALDYVVSLIDPRKASANLPSLHDDLRGLGRGELFDLVLALGTSMHDEVQSRSFKADAGRVIRVGDVPADAMARSGRILLSWPKAFDVYCAEVAAKAHKREGSHGLFKVFGPLAVFTAKDPHLSDVAKAALMGRLEYAMGHLPPDSSLPRKTTKRWASGAYVGMSELRRTQSVSPKTLTRLAEHPGVLSYRADATSIGTVTFVSFEAELVLGHFKDLESEAGIGVSFGLPPDGVRDLAAEYFPAVTGEARKIASEIWDFPDTYSKRSVVEFLDILATCIPVKKVPPKGYVSFMEAMLMFPAGRRPWLAVLEAIIHGRVKAVLRRDFTSTPKIKGLPRQISLSGIEQQRERIITDHANAPTYDVGRVSAVAANLMLGIYNHNVFMACAKARLLTPDDKGAVAYEEVLEFARRYIFANEAAVRARNSSRAIETWLLERGVKPLFKFGNAKGGVIYDRELVEPHLLLRA